MADAVVLLGVRRWGEDELTPIVVDHRNTCGTLSDHYQRGCIGLNVRLGRSEGLVHLTTADALRLSDLLRAMADANPQTHGTDGPVPDGGGT